MDTNFSKIAPICFLYERDTERSMNISMKLRKEFLNAPILDDRALPGLNDVCSLCCTTESVKFLMFFFNLFSCLLMVLLVLVCIDLFDLLHLTLEYIIIEIVMWVDLVIYIIQKVNHLVS